MPLTSQPVVEQIAEAAEGSVVLGSNAIWLFSALEELYLGNSEFAAIARQFGPPNGRASPVPALHPSRMRRTISAS